MISNSSPFDSPTYLMCPPEHFAVEYEINPMMHAGTPVDTGRALEQWHALKEAIADAGGSVLEMPAQPNLPDLVFTRNAGFVWNGRALLARFRHAERRGETPHDRAAFVAHGLEVVELPDEAGSFEGCAEVMPFGDKLIGAHGWRTDRAVLNELAQLTGREIVPVELTIDQTYYHLDVSFAALPGGTSALINPFAMTADSLERLQQVVIDPILLERDEAEALTANAVNVGERVILPALSARLRNELDQRSIDVAQVDVSEMRKGGGAAGCMALPLHYGTS